MSNEIKGTKHFHGHSDTETVSKTGHFVETNEMNHFIIQEREVSYRFDPHFHPYVGQLMQRLLQKSTAGLQAADTEYNNASLPGSVEVELGKNTSVSIPAGSIIALFADLQATLPGDVPIALSTNMQFKVTNTAQVAVPDDLSVKLIDGMTETPIAGTSFNLSQNMSAIVGIGIKITFEVATQITLHNGTQATIAEGTQVLLLRDTQFTIPNSTQVTLLRSQLRPVLYADIFSPTRYDPTSLVQRPYPVKDLDFTFGGAYSIYNWELFFHVPITIAIHLSKNQRFAEAQRWFHLLFDPTDDSDGPTPERFWKVYPFQHTDVKKIEELLVNLTTDADPTLRNETIRSIEAWKNAPFRPHVIASYRQQAYMYKTVMAYLDNLISWGDSLFRQDTGEAIDEAMMVYVLAANILGPRPMSVPKKGSVRPQTYANLRSDLDKFGNAMRDIEADVPFDLMPFPTEETDDNDRMTTIHSLGKALYFCVPRNDKMLAYWDTVADRLFKIRNSLNIQGTFRQLALFEPPIDPALLARAAASGLDVGSIINGLNQPLPLVRFQLLVQKAAEICQEVKSLGNNLLSVMEKGDGEALAILRAKHERVVMEMVEQVRYGQLQETTKSKEGLFKSLALAVQRYTYYEQQLGRKIDEIEKSIPELGEFDKDSLEKMKFSMEEPEMELREIEVDIAQDLGNEGDGRKLNAQETEEIKEIEKSRGDQEAAAGIDKIGATLALIPDFTFNFQPFGAGSSIGSYGGGKLFNASSLISSFWRSDADEHIYKAGKSARIGTYTRREQDWSFQSNLAAGEISQIFKQLRAAQIREAIAELELKNHRQQMKHAEEIERFLNEEGTESKGKQTNKAMYAWMKREVKGLYAQCFQLSFDIAKKAERALQHELGNPELSYLEFGYLAGKEGLLAGDKLYFDIKRMEMAYHDLNQREYELTKHVSLLQVDPLALLQLRSTGRCTVKLPEELFDMDCPGHYFRRIKTVSLSIPCVTGPYASINCTLTLLKSRIRKTQVLGDIYARVDAEDSRFDDYFGSLQSIVTSSAQNDSGLFETNLHDERYLPFEGAGVISEWQLELPADVRQFDYDTISDVILHLRYTAREGGSLLRNGAVENIKTKIEEAHAAGSVRLFSMRHEFPTEWAEFRSIEAVSSDKPAGLTINLKPEHYPFWSKGFLETATINELMLLSKTSLNPEISDKVTEEGKLDGEGKISLDGKLGELRTGKLKNAENLSPTGPLTLFFSSNSMEDIFLVLTWGK